MVMESCCKGLGPGGPTRPTRTMSSSVHPGRLFAPGSRRSSLLAPREALVPSLGGKNQLCRAQSAGRLPRLGVQAVLAQPPAFQGGGAVAGKDKLELIPVAPDLVLANARDVSLATAQYLKSQGVTAAISLEARESLSARQSNWDLESGVLEAAGLPSLWIPVLEDDKASQVQRLPQVVKAIGLLAENGGRVVLLTPWSERGTHIVASLMALGYLCFIEGKSQRDALNTVQDRIPGASPPLEPLDLVREKVKAGETARMIQLAEGIYHRRVQTGEWGTSDTDWQQAQDQFVLESFRSTLHSDPLLNEAVARAQERVQLLDKELGGGRTRPGAEAGMALALPLPFLGQTQGGSLESKAAVSTMATNARLAVLAAELRETNEALEVARRGWEEASEEAANMARQSESLQRKETLYTEALAAANDRINILTAMVRELKGGGEALDNLANGAPLASAAATSDQAKQVRTLEMEASRAAVEASAAQAELRSTKLELTKLTQDRDRERQSARAAEAQLLELEERLGRIGSEAAKKETEAKKLRDELDLVRRDSATSIKTLEERAGTLEAQLSSATQQRDSAEARVLQLEEEGRQLRAEAEGREAAVRSELEERMRKSRETVVLLQTQNQDLERRLKTAMIAAENSSLRLERLEVQVEEVVQKAAAAKAKELTANEVITTLSARVSELEVELEAARRREGQLGEGKEELIRQLQGAAVETRTAQELVAQLKQQVVDLRESESSQRTRADALEASLAKLEGDQQSVHQTASGFCDKLLGITKEVTALNARLAYSEGREHELGKEWQEALGAAAGIMADIGPDAAAAAGTRVVELELEKLAKDKRDSSLDLMQVLMERLVVESATVAERATRVQEQTGDLQRKLEDLQALVPEAEEKLATVSRMREDFEASEGLLLERAGRLEQALLGTRVTLVAALAAAFGIPAAIFSGALPADVAFSSQVSLMQSQIEEKSQAESELRDRVYELEADASARAKEIEGLQGDLTSQKKNVAKLQRLIPLVGPSLVSEEAETFCERVPEEYKTAVTKRYCDILLEPKEAVPEGVDSV